MTVPPFLTMACHCTGCQRMTASAFSLSAAFPGNGFSVSLAASTAPPATFSALNV